MQRPNVLSKPLPGGRTAAGMVVALSVLASGCGDGRTPLTLYSPHGRELLQLLEDAYEAEHPEIDVRWLDMGSQEVYDRIRFEAANPQADIWFGGPDTIFARGAEDGLLEPYRPTWADAVAPANRGPQDLFFGLYLACPILVYNSAAVPEDEAPSDWDDLLDPRWQGKVLIRDPLASGTMRTVFGMVLARSIAETGREEAGFDWLRHLDAQTKEYTLNPALLFEKLTRQEGLVSIWELTDILLLEERNSPLRYRFATSGTPVIDDAIGLVKGAPHPEEARSFIEWAGSLPALVLVAENAFRLPARSDLPVEELPPWARKVLGELVPAAVDSRLLADNGRRWMETWDREVRGKGLAEN
ncbi:MAG: extracellular solute-binding protein [Acidobacteria bacterium]|nr:extracellular solute-binding protein [Acidobacteriota bacterium]